MIELTKNLKIHHTHVYKSKKILNTRTGKVHTTLLLRCFSSGSVTEEKVCVFPTLFP